MKKNVKILSLLMCILLLISIAACGEQTGTEDTVPGSAAVAEDATTKEEETTDPASVPDEDLTAFNFNKTVSIFSMDEYSYEYIATEVNGEFINDAVYKRNSEVCEDLGVTFVYPTVSDNGGQHTNFTNVVSTAYKSGDGENYQILSNLSYYAPSMITSGYLYNYAAIPNSHINTDKNYWNSAYVENGTINGKYYFTIGDMSIRLCQMLEVVYMNDRLADSYLKSEEKNMYQLVYDHEFTFEKFRQLISYADNGAATGVYGAALPCNSYSIDGLQAGFGLDLIEKSSDGAITINTNTEHNVEIVEAMRELYYNNTCVLNSTDCVNAFSGEGALFMVTRLIAATTLQDAGTDYSIYPLPLWNSEQADYISTVHDAYQIIAIISTVDDDTAEMISAVLEDMNYRSTDTVHTAVYQLTYQTRYSDTAEEAEMFEFIYSHINISTGTIYSFPCGELKNTPRYLIYPTTSTAFCNVSSGIASTLKTKEKIQQTQLKTFLKAFD